MVEMVFQQSARKKVIVWLVAIFVAAGAVIVHMIAWHNNGMHLEMFQWPETGKGYLTALYNLVVMLVLGVLLGVLLDRIGNLVGRGEGEKNAPGEEETDGQN
ncbi:MAG: hypothetical protein ISS55_04785 [Dehalococcoidales bacterium]|nr:hypothetical protein [Dehalococcoidales bacterium]